MSIATTRERAPRAANAAAMFPILMRLPDLRSTKGKTTAAPPNKERASEPAASQSPPAKFAEPPVLAASANPPEPSPFAAPLEPVAESMVANEPVAAPNPPAQAQEVEPTSQE